MSMAASGNDVLHSLAHHPNGDLYVAGYTNSFASDHDLFLARYAQDTTLVWAKTYDLDGDDAGVSVDLAIGPTGDVLLCGTVDGIGSGQEDGTVLKLDQNGNVQWARRLLPIPGYLQARALLGTPSGEVYVVGSVNSIGAGSTDAFAARFSATGTLNWLKAYGGTSNDHFTYVDRLTDGTIVAGAETGSYFGNTKKAYVARLATDGSVLSAVQHGPGGYDGYAHTCRNPNGTFLRIGLTQTLGPGGFDVLAVLTDSVGDVLWSRAYGTAGADERGLNAVIDGAGGWYVSAFDSNTRHARLLHVFPNGDLDDALDVNGLFVAPSATWCDPLERSIGGGLIFAGALSASGTAGDMSLVKLDSCGETSCATVQLTWDMTSFAIPEQAIPLTISATSTNVTPIVVTTTDVTVLAVHSVVDCPVCEVELVHSAVTGCVGLPVHFEFPIDSATAATWTWDWDLGLGGSSNAAGALDHTYTGPGVFDVTVIASANSACADTIIIPVTITDVPEPSLGVDTMICTGDQITLSAPIGTWSFLWSDGTTSSDLLVTGPGTYWVEITEQGCIMIDSIIVAEMNVPTAQLGPDTLLCGGGPLLLQPVLTDAQSVLWSDGTGNTQLLVTATGVYAIAASNACGTDADTIAVTIVPSLDVDLGPDTLLCDGETLTLQLPITNAQVEWQDGSSSNTFQIASPGTYWVVLALQGCTGGDTVLVTYGSSFTFDLGPDTVLCDPAPVLLDAGAFGNSAVWQDGSAGRYFTATGSGSYWATIVHDCGAVSDTVVLSFAPVLPGMSDVSICVGEEMRLDPDFPFAQITWTTGSTDQSIVVGEGTYGYTAIDAYGCPHADDVVVYVDPEADGSAYVPNVFSPNADGINDTFEVVGAEALDFELNIFDRWGIELWQSSDPNHGWDGDVDGSAVPDGTYIYVLQYRIRCETEPGPKKTVGHVTLLR
ncbi:MAG: gliding motility-associated C-terminal domain-containing protein [Flavobacteriales bacterium]|nr:gliding motility-associated C-terminal domain-containing protein [Flavobacteriales bacterium]